MVSSWAFGLFSLVVIVAAWRVVTSPNIVRAALALVVVLGGMAPIFLMLAAEFAAVVQILVYVGAVVILFLFGIMLTRSPVGTDEETDHGRRWPGLVIAGLFFAALWYALSDALGSTKVVPESVGTTADVGGVMLRDYVVAFEAVSVLLLAALVGAIVIARRD